MKAIILLKSILIIILFTITVNNHQAQNMPPKYVMLEHFTNTPCPACGSQNPGFFNLLQNYQGDYHHISFHPGRPYSSCIFYQANQSENETRSSFYGISFSPSVIINGLDLTTPGSINAATMNLLTGGESPIHVEVTENTGVTRTVNIDVNVVGTPSTNIASLFAAVVEKEIMYNAPNGETLHHNVFRKFISNPMGNDIDLSQSTSGISFNYTIDPSWNSSEIYTVVWVQDKVTKEVINSGTKFDPPFFSSVSEIEDEEILLFPNPVENMLQIQNLSEKEIAHLTIYNPGGSQVMWLKSNIGSQVNLSSLKPGLYLLELQLEDGGILRENILKY